MLLTEDFEAIEKKMTSSMMKIAQDPAAMAEIQKAMMEFGKMMEELDPTK